MTSTGLSKGEDVGVVTGIPGVRGVSEIFSLEMFRISFGVRVSLLGWAGLGLASRLRSFNLSA